MMKRVVIGSMMLLAAVYATSAAAYDSGNVLANGDFENGTINETADTLQGYWDTSTCGGNAIGISTTVNHTDGGGNSLVQSPIGWYAGNDDTCGTLDDAGQGADASLTIEAATYIAQGATKVTVKGFINTEQLSDPGHPADHYIQLIIVNDLFSAFIQPLVAEPAIAGWQEFCQTMTLPAASSSVTVILKVVATADGSATSDSVYYDDIQVIFHDDSVDACEDNGGGGGGGGGGGSDCSYLNQFDTAGETIATTFFSLPADAWFGLDFDSQGIPDAWDLGVLASILCDETNPMHDAVLAAYEANLSTYENLAASDPTNFGFITSLSLQYYYAGMATLGNVENANAAFGVGVPYSSDGKEPLSALGDLDGDGQTNLDEYHYIAGFGGTRDNYITVVSGGEVDFSLPVAGLVGLALLMGTFGLGGFSLLRNRKH